MSHAQGGRISDRRDLWSIKDAPAFVLQYRERLLVYRRIRDAPLARMTLQWRFPGPGCSPLSRSTRESFVEARNIRDGIIREQQREGCCTISRFWEAATGGKRIAASRCIRKNDFT
ncbi:MAG: hypothetical protein ACR2H5_04975 [Ktedonobacteraceae bacterium]